MYPIAIAVADDLMAKTTSTIVRVIGDEASDETSVSDAISCLSDITRVANSGTPPPSRVCVVPPTSLSLSLPPLPSTLLCVGVHSLGPDQATTHTFSTAGIVSCVLCLSVCVA